MDFFFVSSRWMLRKLGFRRKELIREEGVDFLSLWLMKVELDLNVFFRGNNV